MNVNGTSSNSKTATVDPNKTGFAGLTSETFLKLLITQLQNQDPTEPFDNEALLNQISQMRTLTANLELEETLKAISLGQQLTNATAFIGKTVTAKVDGKEVIGTVERAIVEGGKTILDLGDDQRIALGDVIGVAK
ncbi:MAG: flagellar hook capping protein [Planctomycetaceae bacterium]|jgi:flagellar basal-body rod modification protein FlgD|nr:flagellar hook capping protein [Planctomycetaceae bacterium]